VLNAASLIEKFLALLKYEMLDMVVVWERDNGQAGP
jgi:hypothetical protein